MILLILQHQNLGDGADDSESIEGRLWDPIRARHPVLSPVSKVTVSGTVRSTVADSTSEDRVGGCAADTLDLQGPLELVYHAVCHLRSGPRQHCHAADRRSHCCDDRGAARTDGCHDGRPAAG